MTDFSDQIVKRIEAVLDQDKDNFEQLARSAGLDPGKDFRNISLRGIDFSGCDLTAFDFYGSDLRDCNFTGAIVPEGRLDGAHMDGAITAGIVRVARGNVQGDDSEGVLSDPILAEEIARELDKSVDQVTPNDLLNLKRLDLSFSNFVRFELLSDLIGLKLLSLFSIEITDLSPISGLTALEHLDVDSAGVTDLSPLFNLPNLSFLGIRGLEMNDNLAEQLKELRDSKPNLQIRN